MSDQIADRKIKLEKIRALGVDPYGGRFPDVTRNADIREISEKLDIDAGQILEADKASFRAAGRVVLYRDIGSLIFMTVRDWSGEIQFGLSKKMVEGLALEEGTEARRHEGTEQSRDREGVGSTGSGDVPSAESQPGAAVPQGSASVSPTALQPKQIAWKLAKLIDLGDIVGAQGRLGRTKTGELTLWVTRFSILSKCLRPPPEKRAGLTDIETRYRKRYVDLLANPDSQRVFIQRANIIAFARDVLRKRGFVEVTMPVLQPLYGGAAARPFTTHHNTLDMNLYLQISPELYLKRCMVGGLERVYEFARCFRNEGLSPRHNPEFTMLELYQAYGDYHDMMDITEQIIAGAAREVIGSTKISFGEMEIDYATPWPRRTYTELFEQHSGMRIDDIAGIRERAQSLHTAGKLASDEAKLDDAVVVNELFEHYVEPTLVNPIFVIDYPAPLCPLTRRHPDNPNIALRFECFINGMEMGNAYTELNDPSVQRQTLAGKLRGEEDETMAVMDEDFVESLEYAMPPAGGLGIGIDRMVMLLTGSTSIRDVILFPVQRPQNAD